MSEAPWRTEFTSLWVIMFPNDDDQHYDEWGFAGSDSSATLFQIFQLHRNSSDRICSTMPARNTQKPEGVRIWLGRVPTILWPHVARVPKEVTDEIRKKWKSRQYIRAIWDYLRNDKVIDMKTWEFGAEKLENIS